MRAASDKIADELALDDEDADENHSIGVGVADHLVSVAALNRELECGLDRHALSRRQASRL